jgi:hypothetical protein
MRRIMAILVVMVVGATGVGLAGVIVDKVPDLGPYWHPLGVPPATSVYADSFVFSGGPDNLLATIGIYMQLWDSPPGSTFRFELLGDSSNAPDPSNVLGVTPYLSVSNTALELVTADLLVPVALAAGTRYWITGSTVGQTGGGGYQVGGHTQNSIYPDNGTFWYSNDPNGIVFGGQRLTPEMAIYGATAGTAVPEPAAYLTLLAGLAGLAVLRRRAR